MQKINYYVLASEKTEFFNEYLEAYFIKLDNIFKNTLLVLQEKISQKKDYKNFLLKPEISSLLLDFDKTKNKNSLQKFVNELKIYIKEWIESKNICFNKWEKIPGTNIKLTIEDLNPYNTFEAHPDHKTTGWILGFGHKSKEEWLNIYKKTFELLKKVDSGFFFEINLLINKIIPLGTAKNVHNSASYKECIGHLYLGYEITSEFPEILNLEAIIHEFSHNKLNLIMHFDPIILNAYEEKYYSAIRPDARPISGVFLGYHAFAPTMYILMKAYNDGLIEKDESLLNKIVLYHFKTKLLQKVIQKYANLTEIGKKISSEIDFVIEKMDEIFAQINPEKKLIEKAKQEQKNHFENVARSFQNLYY